MTDCNHDKICEGGLALWCDDCEERFDVVIVPRNRLLAEIERLRAAMADQGSNCACDCDACNRLAEALNNDNGGMR